MIGNEMDIFEDNPEKIQWDKINYFISCEEIGLLELALYSQRYSIQYVVYVSFNLLLSVQELVS